MNTCIVCGSQLSQSLAFPFQITHLRNKYRYFRCSSCDTTSISPVPSSSVLESIYTSDYYGFSYDSDPPSRRFSHVINFLSGKSGMLLDYGFGSCAFLDCIDSPTLTLHGVEYNRSYVNSMKKHKEYLLMTTTDFPKTSYLYDYIHLGDVLEHIPNPAELLDYLSTRLTTGGFILASGPLENNLSLVHFVIMFNGYINALLRPFPRPGMPTHLYRTSANSQRLLFQRCSNLLAESRFITYETGWPYSKGGSLKRLISHLAVLVAHITPSRLRIGNRFFAVYQRL